MLVKTECANLKLTCAAKAGTVGESYLHNSSFPLSNASYARKICKVTVVLLSHNATRWSRVSAPLILNFSFGWG